MLTKSHDHAKYPTELIPNKNSASLNIQQNVTTSTALPPFGSLYRRPRAAAREYTPPLGLGDMSAATDRDVAPTPNPTPPPERRRPPWRQRRKKLAWRCCWCAACLYMTVTSACITAANARAARAAEAVMTASPRVALDEARRAAVRACEARLRALLRRSRRPTSARRSAPTSEVDARLTRRTARRDSATAAESRRRCGHNGYSDGAP